MIHQKRQPPIFCSIRLSILFIIRYFVCLAREHRILGIKIVTFNELFNRFRPCGLVTGALWKDKPRYMLLNKLLTGQWISRSGV